MKLRRFTKNFDLLGGSRKKQYIGKNCLKGGLRQFVDLKGDLVKSRWEEGVFEGGEVDTSMHTMKLAITLTVILIYWCQCLRC